MSQSYVVVKGDTLSGIASRYGTTYQAIAQANGISNPNLIYPGQTFQIPGSNPAPQQQSSSQPQQAPQPQPGVDPHINPASGVWDDNYYARTYGGDSAAAKAMPKAPTLDIVGITNAAYNTPEMTAANKQVSDAQTELTSRQQALADAQATINDNPFYSEATRVGKSQQLTQQANNDMTVIQNKISQAQGQVASLKADAAVKVNAAMGQYNIDEQAYKDNLTQFNNLVSMGALDNMSGQDLANLAVQTGMSTSMIQSIQQASQKKDNPVQVMPSVDNQGNVTLLAVDSNGKVVNQTTIAGVGAAAKSSGGSVKPGSAEYLSSAVSGMTSQITGRLNSYNNISPADWNKALAAWLAQGLSKKDFIDNFGQYADTNRGDFYTAYGFNNPKK